MRVLAFYSFVFMGLSGCAEVRYVEVPVQPELPYTPQLQACADHAAAAQKRVYGDEFTSLFVTTHNLVATAPKFPVGKQSVGLVYDGEGRWNGPKSWQKVRFHCLISPRGQVVYSFVRAF